MLDKDPHKAQIITRTLVMWDQMNKITFKAFSNEPQRHIAKEPDGSVEPLRLRQYSVTFVNICLWKCSELNFLRRVA